MTDLPYMADISTIKIEDGALESYDSSWTDMIGDVLDEIECVDGCVYIIKERRDGK